VSGVRFQQLENHKYQNTNTKWFDKPFDRLTVLSKVEGLTTLSLVEGQITMTDPPEADQTDDPPAFVPNSIISDGQKFGQRYDTTALSVLVIGY
jgi:hypothetical protein